MENNPRVDVATSSPSVSPSKSDKESKVFKMLGAIVLIALAVILIVVLLDDDNGDKGICCIKPGNNLTSEECKNSSTSGQCNALSGCTWVPDTGTCPTRYFNCDVPGSGSCTSTWTWSPASYSNKDTCETDIGCAPPGPICCGNISATPHGACNNYEPKSSCNIAGGSCVWSPSGNDCNSICCGIQGPVAEDNGCDATFSDSGLCNQAPGCWWSSSGQCIF